MPKYEYCMVNVQRVHNRAGKGGGGRPDRPATTDYRADLIVEGMAMTNLFAFTTMPEDKKSSLREVRVRALNILGSEGWSLAGSRYWYHDGPAVYAYTRGHDLTFVREVQDSQADS